MSDGKSDETDDLAKALKRFNDDAERSAREAEQVVKECRGIFDMIQNSEYVSCLDHKCGCAITGYWVEKSPRLINVKERDFLPFATLTDELQKLLSELGTELDLLVEMPKTLEEFDRFIPLYERALTAKGYRSKRLDIMDDVMEWLPFARRTGLLFRPEKCRVVATNDSRTLTLGCEKGFGITLAVLWHRMKEVPW
jgi:hypothetical protein